MPELTTTGDPRAALPAGVAALPRSTRPYADWPLVGIDDKPAVSPEDDEEAGQCQISAR